jgi:hypothetical protein
MRLGLEREGEFCVLFADESRFEGLLSWLGEDLREEPRAFIERGQLALIGGAPTMAGLLGPGKPLYICSRPSWLRPI